MHALAAVAPLAAVILTLVFGRSSRTAAIAGIAVLVPLIVFVFPTPWPVIGRAALEWAPVVTEVILVLAGGILFAEAGRFTGNQQRITDWVTGSLGTGVVPVLAIVHGFTPLTESLTGYGVGAALAVPLLLGLGLPGKQAAIVGLLGLCAVPWGSMGPGTLIASHLSGVDFDALGVTTAIFNVVVFVAVGVTAALLVGAPGQRARSVLAAIGSALALSLAVFGANVLIGTAPAGAIGGLTVLALHIGLRAVRGGRVRMAASVARAFIPYAIVLCGMLAATAAFALARAGSGAAGAAGAEPTGARSAGDSVAQAILTSPALWLFVATGVLLALHRDALRGAVRSAAGTWLRVAPATVLFVALGALMGVSGMTEALAGMLARLGAGYPFFLPLFASLIGFITGSNSGANALGAGAQTDVARALGLDVPLAIGAHNAAAATAMMASPARVELATSLARVPEERGAVQRLLLLQLGVISLVMGGLSFLLL